MKIDWSGTGVKPRYYLMFIAAFIFSGTWICLRTSDEPLWKFLESQFIGSGATLIAGCVVLLTLKSEGNKTRSEIKIGTDSNKDFLARMTKYDSTLADKSLQPDFSNWEIGFDNDIHELTYLSLQKWNEGRYPTIEKFAHEKMKNVSEGLDKAVDELNAEIVKFNKSMQIIPGSIPERRKNNYRDDFTEVIQTVVPAKRYQSAQQLEPLKNTGSLIIT